MSFDPINLMLNAGIAGVIIYFMEKMTNKMLDYLSKKDEAFYTYLAAEREKRDIIHTRMNGAMETLARSVTGLEKVVIRYFDELEIPEKEKEE